MYEEADVKKHHIAGLPSVDLCLQLSAQNREYLWLVRRVKLPSGIHFLVVCRHSCVVLPRLYGSYLLNFGGRLLFERCRSGGRGINDGKNTEKGYN